MVPDAPQAGRSPNHYVCPSCHLYLLTWDGPSRTVEIFHKIGLWEEFGTRHVRLICQSCLGATERVPDTLVDLLRDRFGLGPTMDRRRPLPDP
jgi:hypothetical protein